MAAALLLLCCGCRKTAEVGAPDGSSAAVRTEQLSEIPEPPVSSEQSVLSEPEPVSPAESVSTPPPSRETVPVQETPAAAVPPPAVQKPTVSPSQETRAVWISFLEYKSILLNKTERQFTAAVEWYFDRCVAYGLNTVIVHARSHGDAFYQSAFFPTSVYFTGTRRDRAPFDPLAIMVDKAHERGLRIEAWVNPYRACYIKNPDGSGAYTPLSENDPVKSRLGTDEVFEWGDYYYFNPGEPGVRTLIINGVLEIVDRYAVDGIHMDDYFYPSISPEAVPPDLNTYEKYAQGRTITQFRTDCVNELVSTLYREIKARKNIDFGIAPAGNIQNCLNKSYADVKLWGSTPGYVDYLAPQIYWGYNDEKASYDEVLREWTETVVTDPSVRLLAGLAPYRIGSTAAWSEGNVLSRQVSDARNVFNYRGFILFRYEFFFESQPLQSLMEAEKNNLKAIL